MTARAALLACTFAALWATPASSDGLKDGTYEGGGENGSTLRVIVDGTDVAVNVSGVGCLGMVEGFLARNDQGDLFLVSSSYADDQCAVAILPQGQFSFAMRAGPECSIYHGAACGFDGYVQRVH